MSGRRAGQRFDAELGVATEGLIFLGELDPEAIGARIADATHYEPTPIAEAERLLDAAPVAAERATFVDCGAGMGRVVLLAARRPFRAVVGVEISGALHEVARENLALARDPARRARDVRLVRADAAAFAFPPGDLVLYLFNPFNAAVLAAMLENVRATRAPRDRVAVLYHTPVAAEAVEAAEYALAEDLGFGRVYVRV